MGPFPPLTAYMPRSLPSYPPSLPSSLHAIRFLPPSLPSIASLRPSLRPFPALSPLSALAPSDHPPSFPLTIAPSLPPSIHRSIRPSRSLSPSPPPPLPHSLPPFYLLLPSSNIPSVLLPPSPSHLVLRCSFSPPTHPPSMQSRARSLHVTVTADSSGLAYGLVAVINSTISFLPPHSLISLTFHVVARGDHTVRLSRQLSAAFSSDLSISISTVRSPPSLSHRSPRPTPKNVLLAFQTSFTPTQTQALPRINSMILHPLIPYP